MAGIPVIYRQALTGDRLRHYAPWAKYIPPKLLERMGERLPPKPLWQETIPCGERQAELAVIAGPLHSSNQAPVQGFPAAKVPIVYSHDFPRQSTRRERFSGKILALSLLRRILPDLSRQLALFGDRLSIALAVADWERSFWLSGVEPYARSLTVLLQPNESTRAIGQSGIAVRQSVYASGKVDAHVLIVSPGCMEAVRNLSLREGTILVSTDGLTAETVFGCLSIDMDLSSELGLEPAIWANRKDQFPVLETVIVAAFLAGRLSAWPYHLPRQLRAMDHALAWSQWPASYQLQGRENYS